MRLPRRRRRENGAPPKTEGADPGLASGWRFTSQLDSLRPGLRFTATITYEFSLGSDMPYHPHATARSHLREQARRIAIKYRPLDVEDAEDAVNAALSKPLRTDPRMAISAHVSLALDERTVLIARRQEQTELDLLTADHEESVRLDLLRARMLDPRLGLLWWLDRHAGWLYAPDAPEQRTSAVLAAFRELRAALLRDQGEAPAVQSALVRARVDELLTMLEDPETAGRAAEILEQLVQIIYGKTRPVDSLNGMHEKGPVSGRRTSR
ncbi:hypothetical protein [Streptomyces hygroscopicus]|uniref:hypothetical protein n=1 Tax=Streptomyces hygroscopicus TaxID=1912 RepID=UPI00131C4153|nr:hypothetical protein [Streptomyces hygroscopicus]